MSGLLQRLAGQARGNAAGRSEIRSAMSVHAQVPLGSSSVESPALPIPDPAREATDRIVAPIYKSRHTTVVSDAGARGDAAPAPAAAAREYSPLSPAEQPRISAAARITPESYSAEREPSLPQPLLAQMPVPSLETRATALSFNATHDRESRIRPDTPREPTEVHVHIGRIEVIAAPEKTAPKKTSKPTAPPTIPLAEYLANKARA